MRGWPCVVKRAARARGKARLAPDGLVAREIQLYAGSTGLLLYDSALVFAGGLRWRRKGYRCSALAILLRQYTVPPSTARIVS